MATAADLIRRSLKLLGVLAAGESLPAADLSDGLVELNLLLQTWANDRLLVPGARRSTYTLTPSLSPHTIGTGGTFPTARPLRIDGAGFIAVGQIQETPLTLLTDTEYQAIGNKAQVGELPSELWVEWTNPTARLWLWPVPLTAATLVLYTWAGTIAQYAAADTVAVPDGYENALAHALALQWAPMYGVEPGALLVQNATDALAAIKRTNIQTLLLRADPAILGGGGFNLISGEHK